MKTDFVPILAGVVIVGLAVLVPLAILRNRKAHLEAAVLAAAEAVAATYAPFVDAAQKARAARESGDDMAALEASIDSRISAHHRTLTSLYRAIADTGTMVFPPDPLVEHYVHDLFPEPGNEADLVRAADRFREHLYLWKGDMPSFDELLAGVQTEEAAK